MGTAQKQVSGVVWFEWQPPTLSGKKREEEGK
jgi:hypothetical protein